MRSIEENLSTAIDPTITSALIRGYSTLVTAFRKGDIDTCLLQAGKFVEHTVRAIEYIRSGIAPTEIRNLSQTIREIEKDSSLPETLRALIPKIAYAMIYEIRSKRGAIHVKEIDPRHIDASLCVQAASWIVAELLRLYHVDEESKVMQAMHELTRSQIPLIEMFGDEAAVTTNVPCEIEILLLAAKWSDSGIDRRALGSLSKCSAPSVTRGIQQLERLRFLHKTKDAKFHITGPGARHLTEHLASIAPN